MRHFTHFNLQNAPWRFSLQQIHFGRLLFKCFIDTLHKVLWGILLISNSMCFRISFSKFWLIFSVLSFTFNYRVLILNEILLSFLPTVSGLYFLDLLILIRRMTSSFPIIIQIRIQKPVSFSLGSVIHLQLNTGPTILNLYLLASQLLRNYLKF